MAPASLAAEGQQADWAEPRQEPDARGEGDHDGWNGKPARAGWHWLERRKDGALRMAYWHPKRLNWWVSDEERRTRPMSDPAALEENVRNPVRPWPTERGEKFTGYKERETARPEGQNGAGLVKSGLPRPPVIDPTLKRIVVQVGGGEPWG